MHQPTYDITTTIYLMLQFLFFKVFLCTEVVGKKNWSNGVLEILDKEKTDFETVTYVLTKSIRNSKFEILLPYTPDLYHWQNEGIRKIWTFSSICCNGRFQR